MHTTNQVDHSNVCTVLEKGSAHDVHSSSMLLLQAEEHQTLGAVQTPEKDKAMAQARNTHRHTGKITTYPRCADGAPWRMAHCPGS